MTDLRKLAEAATPGPWQVGDSGYIESTLPQSDPADLSWPLIHWDLEGLGASWRTDDDAAYIAAASPDVVLALLNKVDEARFAEAEVMVRMDVLRAALREIVANTAGITKESGLPQLVLIRIEDIERARAALEG